MPTVVRDNLKNKLYVLVGVGFGSARTARPVPLMPAGPTSMSQEATMVAVANSDGEISWLPSYQVTIVSVDGITCRDTIAAAKSATMGSSNS